MKYNAERSVVLVIETSIEFKSVSTQDGLEAGQLPAAMSSSGSSASK